MAPCSGPSWLGQDETGNAGLDHTRDSTELAEVLQRGVIRPARQSAWRASNNCLAQRMRKVRLFPYDDPPLVGAEPAGARKAGQIMAGAAGPLKYY
jgi:hypothetical protein